MSGPEGSSNKHCIVCAVGIFCPEHSTICIFSVDEESALFLCLKNAKNRPRAQNFGVLQTWAEVKAGSARFKL